MTEWVVSSCVLILIVTALRFLLKGKIALRLQYALWGLVLLRLLVPVSFGESSISVMNAVTVKNTDYYVWHTDGMESTKPGSDVSGQTVTPPVSTAVPGVNSEFSAGELSPDTAGIQLDYILYGIWIIGMAGAAVLLLLSNLRFAVRLRRSRQRTEHRAAALPVYVSGVVETPCLFGLFRPAIYVTPQVLADETALRHVLAHETTHYRHGDHIWALLRCACLALHWYNPLVWLAAALSRRDGELACDEGVIQRIGEEERTGYGRTLIGLTCAKRGALLTTATTMTGSKRCIRERVTLIAKRPKTLTIALVIAVVVSLAAVGCTFTGAEISPDASNGSNTAEDDELISDITVSVGPEVDPSTPVLEWATDYVTQKIQILNDDWKEIAPGNRITAGQITAITDVAAIAMENTRLDLYLLEYRLLLDGVVQQVLVGGLGYEEIDGEVWLTERESAGQPYLLHSCELLEGRIIWTPICTTNTEEIDMIYSANKDLETQFGLDKYTIAAQELYKAHVNGKSGDGVSLTEEEIAQVNEAFNPIVDDGEGNVSANPLNSFFTSYYDRPESMDLVEFLRYFPSDETITDQAEFEALKAAGKWTFAAETLDQMPTPIHKFPAVAISAFLEQHTGISVADLTGWEESGELAYLEEYEAFYNISGDFGVGLFPCIWGEKLDDTVILYSNESILTLEKSRESYWIRSFLPIETGS